MRLALTIAFGFSLLSHANPVLTPVLTNGYIASEKLVVTISPTEAKFDGTFSFKVPGEFPKWKRFPPTADLAVPVWFPETNEDNPSVGAFWRLLRRGGGLRPLYLLTEVAPAYEEAIGLKAHVGESPFTIRGFQTTPLEMDTPDRKYLGLYFWRDVQEPGFSILRFQVALSPPMFTKGVPVRISYRQPLLNADGTRRFFYAPILEHLPASVVSTDTNVYAITLEATLECELAVTYDGQQFSVSRGHSLTLSPKHFQAIRAVVTPWSNQQGEANGSQPIRAETNRAPSTAVSRP